MIILFIQGMISIFLCEFQKKISTKKNPDHRVYNNHISCSRTPKQRTRREICVPAIVPSTTATNVERVPNVKAFLNQGLPTYSLCCLFQKLQTYWKTVERTFACWHDRFSKTYFSTRMMMIRYPKEIMKMEQHFSTLQRWLNK